MRSIPARDPIRTSGWIAAACFAAAACMTAKTDTNAAPYLTGWFETDPAKGFLRGDVCLSALPQQQTYAFLLNRGLNIREVRDGASGAPLKYTGYYNATSVGDATSYRIQTRVGARGFCVACTWRIAKFVRVS
jgi:hypothetical protein